MLFTLKLIGANSLKKALFLRCDLLNSQWCSHQQIPESSLKFLCCMSRNKSTCWNYFLTWHGPDMLRLYTQSYCNYIYRYREWVGSRNRRKRLVEPRATPLEERRRVFFSNLVQTIQTHAGYMYTEDDKFEPIWAFANLQINSAFEHVMRKCSIKKTISMATSVISVGVFREPLQHPEV